VGTRVSEEEARVAQIEAQQEVASPADDVVGGAPAVEEEEEDETARLQSVDSFSTLEDGQPTPPGHLEYRVTGGLARSVGGELQYNSEPELEFTPRGRPFFENFQVLAAVELEGTSTELEPSVNVGWFQRWIVDPGATSWVPTVGTLTELNLPFTGGFGSAGETTETVTVAKMVGPGSVYLNGDATLLVGGDPSARHLVLGMRAGYKWLAVEDKLAVIADYVREQGEAVGQRDTNTAELSVQWELGEHVTLGPGVVFGLDGHPDTPRFGGGVLLLVE
jgi:hypothetical protein